MNKVIIDTSIWIDFFKGRLSQKDKTTFITLMEANQILVPFVVKHELLIGCNSLKEFQFVKRKLELFDALGFAGEDFQNLPIFGFELRKKGLLAIRKLQTNEDLEPHARSIILNDRLKINGSC